MQSKTKYRHANAISFYKLLLRRDEAEAVITRRGKAVKHRGEAEAASFLPRGEASASRHTSLNNIDLVCMQFAIGLLEKFKGITMYQFFCKYHMKKNNRGAV